MRFGKSTGSRRRLRESDRTGRRRCLVVAVVGLCPLLAGAETRVWTSQSGSRIEAEFVRLQEGDVLLRAVDGREFKIGLSRLSEPDQQFVREHYLQPAAPSPSTPVAAVPEAPPTVGGSDLERLTGRRAYAQPDTLSAEHFPGVVATNVPRMAFIGLQYGPAGSEVLYCAFDYSDPQRPASALFVFGPGAAPYRRTVPLQGMRRKVEESRVMSFSDVRVQSSFGDLLMTATLDFYCGIRRSDTILLVARIQLARGATASAFLLGGYLNNDLTHGPGPIRTVPLLAPPVLSLRSWFQRGPVLTGYCSMGRLSLVPQTGMERAINVDILDAESQRVLNRIRVEPDKERLLRGDPDRTVFQPLALQPGRKVLIKSALDLGPFLGTVERTTSFY